jgi:hypothetical protein
MARIRTVKPDFFTSDDVVSLTPLARLLYIGLWCEADREGRMVWRPGAFHRRYLPTDSCDIDAVSGELVSRGLVVLYGDGLAWVPSFSRHQHVNPREAASVLASPPPRVSDASLRVDDAQGGREGKGRKGKEGNVGEGTPPLRAVPPPTDPVPVPFDAWLSLVEIWNRASAKVGAWSAIDTGLTPKAAQTELLRALRSCPDLSVWEARIARAVASAWLTGRKPGADGQPFVADLWWIVDTVVKLDAGRYDDRAPMKVAGLTGGGVVAPTVSTSVWVVDPDYKGHAHRFPCQHRPTCTTWPQHRDMDAETAVSA